MIRRAFTMRLKPGKLDEYKYHHDHIWPEMVGEIERSGIASMSIFHSGEQMFLFSEITDEAAWDRLWDSEVHAKWAAVMTPLMDVTADGKVLAADLQELFHVSTPAGGTGNPLSRKV